MNVILPLRQNDRTTAISHAICAYETATGELAHEWAVPPFLVTLALKVAEVAPDDSGVLAYPLSERQVQIFRFLLGIHCDVSRFEYFLEGSSDAPPSPSTSAYQIIAAVNGPGRRTGSSAGRITEAELTLPTVRLLQRKGERWLQVGALVKQLTHLFAPNGRDAQILAGRSDTYFSQKIRNIVSHRQQSTSFIRHGLAEYSAERLALRLTRLGSETLKGAFQK